MESMDRYIGKYLDNRYEILEVIGVGGMAVVYKALCHRLNRYVAVKILKDEYLRDAEFRKRFHDESQAVAMLSHPNIVAVYDVSSSGGIEYIVMELIDGMTLKDYMKRKGVLSWKETLYFATQTAKALSHAHSRGIIHRDIKPQNIILLRDGVIKVTDFGIARLMMQQQKTMTQEAIGSVHYVAPEQAKGSYIDARADIYSLGVVMYEMQTGRLPFEGDTPIAVAMQHINAIPLMPREIVPSVPEGLEAITMKAMNPSLAQRYVSADELLADLEKFRLDPNIVFPYKRTPAVPVQIDDSEKTVKLTGLPEELKEFSPRRDYSKEAVIAEQSATQAFKKDSSAKKKKTDSAVYSDSVSENANTDGSTDNKSEGAGKRVKFSITFALIAVALFFVGAVFFAWRLLGIGLSGPESANVPSLIGKMYDEVITDEEYADFNIVETAEMYHETMADGMIIKQSPDAGRASQKGATISVTVSRGQKSVEVPDLQNYEYSLAQVALSRLGLLINEEYEVSKTIREGCVIRTVPEQGSSVMEGDIVTVVISQGSSAKSVKVPYVEGKTETEARSLLEEAGLLVSVTTSETDDYEDGTVMSQSIESGSKVPEKTTVELVVSISAIAQTPVGTDAQDPDAQDAGSSSDTSQSGDEGSNDGSSSGQQTYTYNLKINLEKYSGDKRVTVKLDGVTVYDNMVNASAQSMLVIPIQGSGTGYVYVYVDNKSIAEQPVVFE